MQGHLGKHAGEGDQQSVHPDLVILQRQYDIDGGIHTIDWRIANSEYHEPQMKDWKGS